MAYEKHASIHADLRMLNKWLAELEEKLDEHHKTFDMLAKSMAHGFKELEERLDREITKATTIDNTLSERLDKLDSAMEEHTHYMDEEQTKSTGSPFVVFKRPT